MNVKRTPSITSSSPVRETISVGAISVTSPFETPLPRPEPTAPRSSVGNNAPYMYIARRVIAFPAMTFSETAYSMKPSGAMIRTFPVAASSAVTTPLTPPKWSAWLWL